MLRPRHSLENHGCAVLAARAFVGNVAVRHRRSRHSLENQGGAVLSARLSAEIEGVGDAAVEAFA